MTQEELLQTIPGSVISAKSDNGTPWTQTYSAYKGGKKKGTISVNFGGLAMKSKWFVKDNQWCENWGSGQACWDIERVGTKSLQLYENGEPKKNLWNLN